MLPASAEKHAPPPLFALLVLPFAFVVGFSDVALSYIFRERGLTEELAGVVVFFVGLPHTLKFLWAPALDAGTRRKVWYLGSVVVSAVALAVVALVPPEPFRTVGPLRLIEVYAFVLLIAQAAVATSASAVDALMALTIPNEKKGAVAGWSMAGNVGGTALGGALITHLARVATPVTTAIVFFVVIVLFGLPILFVREPAPQRQPVLPAMRALLRDLWSLLKSRDGWTGVILCLSPIGAGAATRHFGGLATDYVSDPEVRGFAVTFVDGVGGAVVSAIGGLAGGYLADKINRRLLYCIAGAVTAAAAIAMAAGPADTFVTLSLWGDQTITLPVTYTLGCLGYQLANGVAYAAFAAFVLEMIGHGPGVTTKYTLFVGASNLALSYVALIDGLGYGWGQAVFPDKAWAGRVGTLGVDAIATVIGIVVLGVVLALTRRRPATGAAS